MNHKQVTRPLALITLLLSVCTLHAQEVRIIPFAGYSGQGSVHQWSGSDIIYAGSHYGLITDVAISERYHLQFTFTKQSTDKERYPLGTGFKYDMAINRLQLGFSYGKEIPKTPLRWAGGMDAGAGMIVNKTTNQTAVRLAMNFKGAAYLKITRSVEFMTQAQVMYLVGARQPARSQGSLPVIGSLAMLSQPAVSAGLAIAVGKHKDLNKKKIR